MSQTCFFSFAMAYSTFRFLVSLVVVVMLLVMAEATPPGIAKNPSHATCKIKKYKHCYNLVHVCPKFCPDQCYVECASCKPICGSDSNPPPEDTPTPNTPTSPPPPSKTYYSPPPPVVVTPSPPSNPTPSYSPPLPSSPPPPPSPVIPSPPPPTPSSPSPPSTGTPSTPPTISSPPPVTPTPPLVNPNPPASPPTPVNYPQSPPPPTNTKPPSTPPSNPAPPTISPPHPVTSTPPPTTPPANPNPLASPPTNYPPSPPPPTNPNSPSNPTPPTISSPPPVTSTPPAANPTPPTSPSVNHPSSPPPPTNTNPPSTPPENSNPPTPSTPNSPLPTPPSENPNSPPTKTPPPAPSTPSPPSTTTPPSSSAGAAKRVRCKNVNYPKCYNMIHTCPSGCPNGCEVDCVTCKPVCHCDRPGAVCQDPRFVGGDGITFYFHGKKDKDFCLVSDPDLHINAHFIGKRNPSLKRDFTWVQSLAILFHRHRLVIAAQKTYVWDNSIDRLTISLDDNPVALPITEGSRLLHPIENPTVVIVRLAATNHVMVEAKGLFRITAKVVPITKEDSRIHNYGIEEGDSFAHLDVGFKFFGLSKEVTGILGQTYGAEYVSRVNVKAAMAVMGRAEEFETSSLFAADCAVSRFVGGGSGSVGGIDETI